MHGVGIIRCIVGVIGNVISGLLFISPMPTFWRICKKKSTEEFHPYPYIAATMNCMLWIFYGLPVVHPDSILVITINSFGLALEFIYLFIFFIYTSKQKYMWIIMMYLLCELVLLGVIIVITILCFHTHEKRSMFVGILCDIFGIIMYGSPLSKLYDVYKEKSAEFMPFWLCVAGFTNGITWTIYAFLQIFDPYIAVGNGIGALLGLIQLTVFAYYTIKAKSNASNSEAKSGDMQLSNPPPI
ncbi:bidirectional sugar transporter SWEET7-like [Salvia miltiorrhiza]|uniref:bidirectional sugar transporter SWEET7-like n=1 Tax=Salvia miltiorrhiza TaxID=226208 RepID=UPI0025AC7A25|nr:bidirectional sugar transporter SWEET7-like [Salvia miltiorrhiza]